MRRKSTNWAADMLAQWDALVKRNAENPPASSDILKRLLAGEYTLRTLLIDLDACYQPDKSEFYDALDTLRTDRQRGHHHFFWAHDEGPAFALNIKHFMQHSHARPGQYAQAVDALSTLLAAEDYVASCTYRELFSVQPLAHTDTKATVWWAGWFVYQPRGRSAPTKCALSHMAM